MKPLSKESYAGKSWKKFTSYDFAGRINAVPLVGVEIAKAAVALPMAFFLHQEKYILMAVLSPVPGENCFIDSSGRWMGSYVPSFFRSRPFKLGRITGSNELCLCVDEDSGLVQDSSGSGEPFFDDSGSLAPPVQNVKKFLEKVEQSRKQTQKAVNALAHADLMLPWDFMAVVNQEQRRITGYFQIDESRLNKLADTDFLTLRNSGALSIAYAHMLSLGNISKFSRFTRSPDKKDSTSDPDLSGFDMHDSLGI